jgi:HEXXH motif-containing protein
MTSKLIELVTEALENSFDSPWLPGLAGELAEVVWRNLYNDMGLIPSNYGTARVMARSKNAPRRIVTGLPIPFSADGPGRMHYVETLEEDFARSYDEAGVRFYTAEQINNTNVLEQLEEAINYLKLLPSLYEVAANLVKSIHLINPDDDDYDISFSEPHIPFTIFVSIPLLRSLNSTLRVAEAIVHETMHLQLTLVERVVALTNPTNGRYFSPWRGEYRTAQGLLHALYVFRVIDCFFGELLNRRLIPSIYSEYLHQRKHEIAGQFNKIREFSDCPELTNLGKNFVQKLVFKYG